MVRCLFRKQVSAWLLLVFLCCHFVGALHICHQHDDATASGNCLVCSWNQDLTTSVSVDPLVGAETTSEPILVESSAVVFQSSCLLPFGPRAPPSALL